MNTKRFNKLLAEVGGRPVPIPEAEGDDETTEVKITVEKDTETQEAILREATAVFNPKTGTATVSVPLAEQEDVEAYRRARFNKRLAAVGGRPV